MHSSFVIYLLAFLSTGTQYFAAAEKIIEAAINSSVTMTFCLAIETDSEITLHQDKKIYAKCNIKGCIDTTEVIRTNFELNYGCYKISFIIQNVTEKLASLWTVKKTNPPKSSLVASYEILIIKKKPTAATNKAPPKRNDLLYLTIALIICLFLCNCG